MWNLCKRDRRPKTMVYTKTRNIFNARQCIILAMYIKKIQIYFSRIYKCKGIYITAGN